MVSQKSTTLQHALTVLTDMIQIGYKNTGKKGVKSGYIAVWTRKKPPDNERLFNVLHQMAPVITNRLLADAEAGEDGGEDVGGGDGAGDGGEVVDGLADVLGDEVGGQGGGQAGDCAA